MENIKLQHKISLIKIELNNNGDYLAISPDDATFFDKFIKYTKDILELADSTGNKIENVGKDNKDQDNIDTAIEISDIRIAFSVEATRLTDMLFGEDTIKKYFYDIYDEIPDFVPDEECFIDFLNQITPAVEQIFNKRVGAKAVVDTKKVKKYEPQDHKAKK